MRILVVANSSTGLVKFRKELIQRLQEENEVFVATKMDMCVEELQTIVDNLIEIDMDRRGINLFMEFKLYKAYQKVINSVKPDMIITYTIKPNIYCGLIAKKRKIEYIANITGLGTAFQKDGLLKKCITVLYRMALNNAKVVFFENEINAKVFIDNKIIREKNKHVLRGAGVNLKTFAFQPYPLQTEKINFLYMGRLMREKGVNELFEAAEKLGQLRNDFVLTVLGDYEEDYISRICELEKLGIINYIGWVEDVKPYIKECACAILPSYHEGMSNTLLECAAMGRPIIASDIPGCRETLLDGKSGYLVCVKDMQDLLDKMNQFCSISFDERKQMGIEARKHVEKWFAKDKVVKETIEKMGL